MSKRSLLALAFIALASISIVGCSLSVKSTLDDKDPVPSDECVTSADCSGAFVECRDVNDGVSQWKACACAFGYELDDATGDCAWVGIVEDPGFEDSDAWIRRGGVAVAEQAGGGGDLGAAEFETEGTCEYASVVQTIDMSPREATGPMVAEVTLRVYSSNWVPSWGIAAGVGINGRWHSVQALESWETRRVCLGEGVAGEQVELAVGPYLPHLDCRYSSPDLELQVSRVEVLPADPGECGEPAVVPNPTFEAAGGWTGYTNGGAIDVSVAPGVGEGGTSGLRMLVTSACAYGGAAAPVTWPEEPATGLSLKFWWRGTAGYNMEVRAGAQPLAVLAGTGAEEATTICIPPWVRGTAQPLTFGNPTRPDPNAWCSNGIEFVVDNITLQPDAACAGSGGAVDPSFELATDPAYAPMLLPFTSGTLTAGAEVDALHARTGDTAYRIASSNDCDYTCRDCWPPSPETYVGSPGPSDEGGAALSLWYLSGGLNTYQLKTTFDGNMAWFSTDPTWQRHSVCLPPGIGGRPVAYRYEFRPPTTCSVGAIATEQAWVDDVASYIDPACP